jgi:hypothetical protein
MRPGRWRTFGMRYGLLFCLLLTAVVQPGCSIPNLEGQSCTEARDTVKEFYSWYLGTDPEARSRQKDIYDRYVSADFRGTSNENGDPFFLATSTPTTFKIGKCGAIGDSKVEMQVQLYWRSDNKTDQHEVYAETVKKDNKWLIEEVRSH